MRIQSYFASIEIAHVQLFVQAPVYLIVSLISFLADGTTKSYTKAQQEAQGWFNVVKRVITMLTT